MNSNDWYRLFELECSTELEEVIKEVVATLDNYKFLKTKLPKCNCSPENSRLIVEGICSSCGGLEVDKDKYIMRWKW